MKSLASRLGMPLDGSLGEQIADEQLSMVLSHTSIATFVATAFALLLAFYLRGQVEPHLLVLWVVMKVLVAVPRVLQQYAYRREAFASSRGWRQTAYWLLLLDGTVWGLGGFWMMAAPVPTASMVCGSLCCVACLAMFGLQVNARAAAAYVAPIVSLMALGLALRFDAFGTFGAVGLSLFLGLLLMTAARGELLLAEKLMLRMQASRLGEEKAAALRYAQRESASKSQFLGTVTHELRTPVHGVLGVARLVHVESSDPVIRKRMELIETSAAHLLAMVNDLIDISKVGAGAMRLHEAQFDLNEEIARLADIYTVRASEKGLSFTLDNKLPVSCWVGGDPVRTRQVLHNLLGNAIKFTQRGWVQLLVERGEREAQIRFVVRDTGLGIAESQQEAIFEAFAQLNREPGDRPSGAGLGLTISREIARRMGGDITVESRLGFGSIFTFATPLNAASEPAGLTGAARGGEQLALRSGDGARVLLAEDNEVNALIATSILKGNGYEVERVGDGAQAVVRALREVDRPALVLMDDSMPVMTGIEATRSIRKQEQALGLARIPILAITAALLDEGLHAYRAAGMDAALAKPFSAAELLEAIEEWVGPRLGTT
ncbi:MAG TPA: ATP-binding protein [Methylibium sp.]